jgi:hypothetical protein
MPQVRHDRPCLGAETVINGPRRIKSIVLPFDSLGCLRAVSTGHVIQLGLNLCDARQLRLKLSDDFVHLSGELMDGAVSRSTRGTRWTGRTAWPYAVSWRRV